MSIQRCCQWYHWLNCLDFLIINQLGLSKNWIATSIDQIQESIPVGCVPSTAVAVSPATHAPPSPKPPATHAPPPAMHAPLWTEWLIDRCENITFPQLRLRTVIMQSLILTLQINHWRLLWTCQSWSWKWMNRVHCKSYVCGIHESHSTQSLMWN